MNYETEQVESEQLDDQIRNRHLREACETNAGELADHYAQQGDGAALERLNSTGGAPMTRKGYERRLKNYQRQLAELLEQCPREDREERSKLLDRLVERAGTSACPADPPK